MKTCRSKKRHWPTQAGAMHALARIQDNPDPARLYHASGVVRCDRKCGGYVLTSDTRRSFASGKTSRHPQARRRTR